MRGHQFYMALDAAREADKIADFATRIGANEPVLQMDKHQRIWDVATSSDVTPGVLRLHLHCGKPSLALLEHYLGNARDRPATTLVSAGVRYVELNLPYVRSMLQHRCH